MHKAVAPYGDCDMRCTITASLRVEEDEIARFDVGGADLIADLVLLFDDAWDRDAILREHVLHQSAAVEAGGVGSSESIGDSSKPHRKLRDGAAVEPPCR